MKAMYGRLGLTIFSAAVLMTAVPEPAIAASEVFTATATVKTADGKSGSEPVNVTIDRTMPAS